MRPGRILFIGSLGLAVAGCFTVLDFGGYATGDAPALVLADGGTGAFRIALDRSDVTLSRGERAAIEVTVERSAGFAGSLALFLTGADGPFTASFAEAIVAPEATRTVLTVTLDAALTADVDVDLALQAKSGAAVAEAPLRLHLRPPSGSPDLALGPDGVLRIPTGAPTSVRDLAIGPDGAIVVAGDVAVGARLAPLLVRVTAGGAADPTFGDGGAARLLDPRAVDASARAVDVQSDEGVVALAGQPPYVTTPLLYRATATAARDVTFGDGGILLLPDPGTGQVGCDVVTGKDDATFVLAATTPSGGAHPQLVVTGRARDGSALAGFGRAGVVTLPFLMKDDEPCGSIVLLDGGVALVLGKTQLAQGIVARLRADGTLDSTFGNDGGLVYVAPDDPRTTNSIDPRALAIDGDRIVVGSGRASNSKLEVMRLLADGARDPSFGGTGVIESATDYIGASRAQLAVDGARRIVTLARTPDADALVVRRIGVDGTYDATFAGSGAIAIDGSRGVLGLQSDGKIVVAHGTDDGVVVHRWYP